jgi:predicted metal-dependent hydrolase
MQQDILNALKTRFEGVSDKILQRLADKLQKQPNPDQLGAEQLANQVTMQQLLEYYGDQRATEAQQTAVRNYEKKMQQTNQTNEGQPQSNQAEPQTSKTTKTIQDPAEVPAWAKSLVEQVKTLNQKFEAVEQEKQERTRRDQMEELIKGLPQTVRQAYRRIQLGDLSDQDFEKLKEDVTQEAAQILQETGARSAVFSAPSQAGIKSAQKTASDKEITDVVKALNV